MTFVAGKYNLADILTKAQAVAVFRQLMQLYNRLHSPAYALRS